MSDQHPASQSSPANGRQPPVSSGAGPGGSVLVVDDNAVHQLVAVRLLEQRGFHVDVATDGSEAVRMHESGDYDLIFMDCEMPGIDGYTATVMIREHEAQGRRAPIIALTANTATGDRERCLAVGMDDHIAKPLSHSELDAALARARASSSH